MESMDRLLVSSLSRRLAICRLVMDFCSYCFRLRRVCTPYQIIQICCEASCFFSFRAKLVVFASERGASGERPTLVNKIRDGRGSFGENPRLSPLP